jgi:hypothetical protein
MTRAQRALPDPSFVDNVQAAFVRRRKPIKHHGVSIEWKAAIEAGNDREAQMARIDVDLSYRAGGQRILLRLIAWDDRWIWLDARRSTKRGWAWSCTVEGRFFAAVGARELVARLERTIVVTYGSSAEVPALMRRLWRDCLATGPRLI